MKNLCIILLLFIQYTAFSQLATGPEIAWQRCYGGSGDDFFYDAAIDLEGKMVTTSQNVSTDGYFSGKGIASGWVAKFNLSMEIEWENFYSYTDCNYTFHKIIALNDSNYLLSGDGGGEGCLFTTNGESDYCLLKIDKNGNMLWEKFYGSITGSDLLESLLPTSDGGFLLTGYSNGSGGDIPFHYGSGFTDDAIIIKTDSIGEIQWLKVLGGSGDDLPIGDVVELERGYYIVNISSHSSDFDLADSEIDGDKRWIVKLDSLGNIVDEKFYSGVDDLFTFGGDQVFQINNKFYVVGAGNPASTLFPETVGFGGYYDGAIAEFDSDLDFTRLRLFGGESTDFLKRSVIDLNGNIYFLGVSKSLTGNLNGNYNNGETLDYWLFATDSNFNPLWSKNFGGSDPCGDLGCSNFSGNLVLKDNMLYAFIKNVVPETLPDYDIQCGTLGPGDTDAWLVAFDLTTGIQQEPKPQELFSINPNPANNTIIISSTVAINAPIQITISNINGMQVFNNAYYMQDTMQINLPDLPNGMYVIHILNTTVQNTQLLFIMQP